MLLAVLCFAAWAYITERGERETIKAKIEAMNKLVGSDKPESLSSRLTALELSIGDAQRPGSVAAG